MKILFTRSFKKDYKKLPSDIQKTIDKQIALLLEKPGYPSLNMKKMQGQPDIWEGRITHGYRFTFQFKEDMAVLRRVGTHDMKNP